ncbi:MAG: GTP cyclohydrolase I [Hyphomicrobiaceae bacterium]
MRKHPTATLAAASPFPRRPTRAQAEQAVRTLLAWAGDDPDRDELRDTPKRVVEAYAEYFSGYRQDPIALLQEPMPGEISSFNDIVLLRGIEVESHCAHHISPFSGRASVAYIPAGKAVGLSRLARVVDAYARRLQTQEDLTNDIAKAIDAALAPSGVAVLIEAEHHCIAARGPKQHGLTAVTTRFLGAFDSDAALQERFMRMARG